jgi:hypothetical protein
MCKRRNVLVALVGLLTLAACGVGPKGVGKSEYAAISKAFNALKRANDYRDAGSLIYEPRFLDAEKAVEELESTASMDGAVTAAQTARSMLVNYRAYLGMEAEVGRGGERRRDADRLQAMINQNASIEFQIRGYISTLYSYID